MKCLGHFQLEGGPGHTREIKNVSGSPSEQLGVGGWGGSLLRLVSLTKISSNAWEDNIHGITSKPLLQAFTLKLYKKGCK